MKNSNKSTSSKKPTRRSDKPVSSGARASIKAGGRHKKNASTGRAFAHHNSHKTTEKSERRQGHFSETVAAKNSEINDVVSATQCTEQASVPKRAIEWVEINEDMAGQRIDNFLRTHLKNIPKSMIYRIVRKGEVRVNKKRVKADYKLTDGDLIRIPPMVLEEKTIDAPVISPKLNSVKSLLDNIVYEDEHLLIVNKASGMAVHGGSGLQFGVIEAVRQLRPDCRFLELIHRIDRDTSGLLLIAKKRSALRFMQAQFREKTIKKTYFALVKGQWKKTQTLVNAPLKKDEINSIVRVNPHGKPSQTRFEIGKTYSAATLLIAKPITGRTHQIRVHTQYAGHPIACDDRYGDESFDLQMRQLGLNRLFLHAQSIEFVHPKDNQKVILSAPLSKELESLLAQLN